MRAGHARRNSRQMNCANPSIFEKTGEPCHLFAGVLIEHDPWNGDPPGGVSALEQQLDFPVLIPAALVVIFRSAGTRELATNMLLEAQPCGRRREAVAGRPRRRAIAFSKAYAHLHGDEIGAVVGGALDVDGRVQPRRREKRTGQINLAVADEQVGVREVELEPVRQLIRRAEGNPVPVAVGHARVAEAVDGRRLVVL